MKTHDKKCTVCSESYVARRSDAKFCSRSCQLQNWHEGRKRIKHSVQGLSEGEKRILWGVQQYSPRTAKQIATLIRQKGAHSAKPILSIMVQFMTDTGKLTTVGNNTKVSWSPVRGQFGSQFDNICTVKTAELQNCKNHPGHTLNKCPHLYFDTNALFPPTTLHPTLKFHE